MLVNSSGCDLGIMLKSMWSIKTLGSLLDLSSFWSADNMSVTLASFSVHIVDPLRFIFSPISLRSQLSHKMFFAFIIISNGKWSMTALRTFSAVPLCSENKMYVNNGFTMFSSLVSSLLSVLFVLFSLVFLSSSFLPPNLVSQHDWHSIISPCLSVTVTSFFFFSGHSPAGRP